MSMMFGMAMPTKHLSDSWITEYICRQYPCVNALEEFTLRSIVMNMQCMLTATALCFFAAILAVVSFQSNNLVSPLTVSNSPVVASMDSEWFFASGMPTDISGDADRWTLHGGKDVDLAVTATGANMLALLAGNPLDSFRGQSFATKVVPLNVLWGTDRIAIVSSFDGNHHPTSTSAALSRLDREPLIYGLAGRVFIAKTISHSKNLASDELLEPLPGRAEGNQQRSRGYTPGTFRDYLSRTVGLITGHSVRVRKFHSGHDIVRTFEKSRGNSSMILKIQKSGSVTGAPMEQWQPKWS